MTFLEITIGNEWIMLDNGDIECKGHHSKRYISFDTMAKASEYMQGHSLVNEVESVRLGSYFLHTGNVSYEWHIQ